MASTTVHIPEELLHRVDELARRRSVSRNRIVIEALEEEISRDAGAWPPGFLEAPADPDARTMLAEAADELERAVLSARRNRGAPLL